MTGAHRDTIMRLALEVGQGCKRLLDEKMRGLSGDRIQCGEISSFVAKHDRSMKPTDSPLEKGDIWTFVAFDADTRLVPAFYVGKRTRQDALMFMRDLTLRLNRPVPICANAADGERSAVEKQKLAVRLGMQRFARTAGAFSKKIENHRAALALHFAHHNFVQLHRNLKITPAMAAGVCDNLWTVEDLVGASLSVGTQAV